MKRSYSKKKMPERVAVKKDRVPLKEKRRRPVFNLLLAFLLWLTTVTLFYSGRFLPPPTLTLGQQAPDTLVVTVDFDAENIAATDLKRQLAAEAVLSVFSIDLTARDRAANALDKLLPRLHRLRNAPPEQQHVLRASVDDLLELLGIPLTHKDLLSVLPPTTEINLQNLTLEAIRDALTGGIVSETDRETLFSGLVRTDNIRIHHGESETIHTLLDFRTRNTALDKAAETVIDTLPRDQRNKETIRALLGPWITPNLLYDTAFTAERRERAAAKVEPVIESIAEGSILVREGETVTGQTLQWIEAHQARLSELETGAERAARVAGSSLLLLAGIILAIAVSGLLRHSLLRNRREVLLLVVLSILTLGLSKLIFYLIVYLQLLPSALLLYALPLGVTVILASVLLGGIPALLLGLWNSFAVAMMLDQSFEALILGLIVTLAAIYTTRNVLRRSTLFKAGFWIGVAKVAFVLLSMTLNRPAWNIVGLQAAAALISGIGCALLAILLIPVFEHLFKITTDISLLELSDMSHPLLQRLAIEAPGTYHHSLMLASLAAAGAEAINCTPLHLRVCAYFHDIGKLVKPGFFSENIQFSNNPHDELAPTMSTLVVVSHIKEGVTLAKKHKLPKIIVAAIEQHQGTGLVSVFYHREKTRQQKTDETKAPPAVNDEDFRYEGPKPQTREMAVLMLADSCEAASRSLEKPTPIHIINLVDEIVGAKIKDGQLDECGMTFAELRKVKEAFSFTLTNMLHGRVAYPKDENDDTKPAEEISVQSAKTSGADE